MSAWRVRETSVRPRRVRMPPRSSGCRTDGATPRGIGRTHHAGARRVSWRRGASGLAEGLSFTLRHRRGTECITPVGLGVTKPLKALFREARVPLSSMAHGRCCSMASAIGCAGRRHRGRPCRHRRLGCQRGNRLAREVMRSPRRSGSADLSGIERRIASDIRRTRR